MFSISFRKHRDENKSRVINSFSKILTFYAKDKKDTTKDEEDILGTKQGHSGQKETIGTFEVSFFSGGSLAREITRGATARCFRFRSMTPRVYGL